MSSKSNDYLTYESFIKRNNKSSQEKINEIYNLNADNLKNPSKNLNFLEINSNPQLQFSKEPLEYLKGTRKKNYQHYHNNINKELNVDNNYHFSQGKNMDSNSKIRSLSNIEESEFSKLNWPKDHETIIQMIKNKTNIHNVNLDNYLGNVNESKKNIFNSKHFNLQYTPSSIINNNGKSMYQGTTNNIQKINNNDKKELPDYQYLINKNKIKVAQNISPNHFVRRKLKHLNHPFVGIGNSSPIEKREFDFGGKYSDINFKLIETQKEDELKNIEPILESKQDTNHLTNKVILNELKVQNAGEANITNKILDTFGRKYNNLEKNPNIQKNMNIPLKNKSVFKLDLNEKEKEKINDKFFLINNQEQKYSLSVNKESSGEISETYNQLDLKSQNKNTAEPKKEPILSNLNTEIKINNDKEKLSQKNSIINNKEDQEESKTISKELNNPPPEFNINNFNKLTTSLLIEESNAPSPNLDILDPKNKIIHKQIEFVNIDKIEHKIEFIPLGIEKPKSEIKIEEKQYEIPNNSRTNILIEIQPDEKINEIKKEIGSNSQIMQEIQLANPSSRETEIANSNLLSYKPINSEENQNVINNLFQYSNKNDIQSNNCPPNLSKKNLKFINKIHKLMMNFDIIRKDLNISQQFSLMISPYKNYFQRGLTFALSKPEINIISMEINS